MIVSVSTYACEYHVRVYVICVHVYGICIWSLPLLSLSYSFEKQSFIESRASLFAIEPRNPLSVEVVGMSTIMLDFLYGY